MPVPWENFFPSSVDDPMCICRRATIDVRVGQQTV